MNDSAKFAAVWSTPPVDMNLGTQDVHAWLIPLDKAGQSLAKCAKVISQDEQDRAGKFKFDKDRRRYIVAHAALRLILSDYLRAPSESLKFSAGPNGKPYLDLIPGTLPIQFNLSHSNEVALLAVNLGREIGIDVEYVKRDFPIHEIAQRFFAAREVAAIASLPECLQRQAFYKCWTSKEAFLKAKGIGLSGKLDEVNVRRTAENSVRVEGTIADWTLTEIELSSEYMAAVVVQGAQSKVRCYDWKLHKGESLGKSSE